MRPGRHVTGAGDTRSRSAAPAAPAAPHRGHDRLRAGRGAARRRRRRRVRGGGGGMERLERCGRWLRAALAAGRVRRRLPWLLLAIALLGSALKDADLVPETPMRNKRNPLNV